MCGICGIAIPERLNRSVDPVRLTRMRDALVHRGPDGAGLFVDGPIGLGHRRLSIVDVAHGAQPMTTDDGRSTIVYNGEVYNHPALMQGLRAEGVRYHTHCDTETVLHLYARHGRDFVQHCRGMFAIAIWDRADRTLTLARDRFGVKPVYYVHAADGTLHFASEIKALLASGAVAAALHMASFPDFLANHAPSSDETMFTGVKRLPPGHTLRWHDGTIEISQYWDLSFVPDQALARERCRPDGGVQFAVRGGGSTAPDVRCATWHVSLRGDRFGGDHCGDERHGRWTDQDLLGGLRRTRSERTALRTTRVGTLPDRPSRDCRHAGAVLGRVAVADLA